MVKLLFIYGPLGGGGAERVLIDLLSNVDYTRYEVDLCLIVRGGILLPEVPKQVNIIPLWKSYDWHYKLAYRMSVWMGNNYLFKRKMYQKLTKEYDVEISFLEGMPLKLHALIQGNAKKVTWVHCDLFQFHYTKHQFYRKEELRAYQSMDRIVSVSNDAKKAFERRFPLCKTKHIVIYNPIDIPKILRMVDGADMPVNTRFTVVTVGRLTPQKKIDRVIRLAYRCKQEGIDVQFQIIGDGELKAELVGLSEHLGVSDRVSFFGFVANPFPYIKAADMMLLSSGYEGFGLVVCEAMVLGTPVVATKTAGPIEIIGDNQYGMLCEHDDDAIYRAFKKMFTDKELREKYTLAGKERVKDFGIEKMITEFEKLITDIQ